MLHREHHGVQGRQGCAGNTVLCGSIRGPRMARSVDRTDGHITSKRLRTRPPSRPLEPERKRQTEEIERPKLISNQGGKSSVILTDTLVSPRYVRSMVSSSRFVQLFCLSGSGLIGSRYEYERTRISR